MRIRIAWGGGVERLWRGNVAVSRGKLSEPCPLGIEADEPGSMWLETSPLYYSSQPGAPLARIRPEAVEEEHLVIRQRSPRSHDEVDVLVTAPVEARLLIELRASDDQRAPQWIEIPLTELLDGFYERDLDDRGNRLLVRRTPGDTLRIAMHRRSLVFAPGEVFEFEVLPHLLPGEPGSKAEIKIELAAGRSTEALWHAEHGVLVGQPACIRQEIVLPAREGVYDVIITATPAAGLPWPQTVSSPLHWKKEPLARRKIQLVVLNPQQPALPSTAGSRMSTVVEIDPANPKWWERFAKLPHLRRPGRLWKGAVGPLGNGNARTIEHPLGQLVQLGPARETSDVAWEAYTLPIEEPGRPHVLEFDYPSDVPQTVGISIVEPNPSGAVFPIGLDSGVDLAEEVAGGDRRPHWLHHRVIFWPRTKAPMVLITNRRDRSAAVYGKIRVRVFEGEHLPRAFPLQGPQPARLLGAYLDRPLFPENFSASEAPTSLSDLGVDDWVTFYEGGTRLVEYLNYVGFNGLMISVLADGSTIYPSEILEPTPRYDTGVFFDTGQDPVRKDVLEMLFRLFDRQRLELIPALEFAAPLPELEAVLRRGGPEAVGIQWVGPQGLTWQQTHLPVRGMAPYYNVLHPRVQEAMLAVVRELVSGYGHHASFAGLAIHLSADGYAQLPGSEWGMDDATIARFEQDTGVRIPGTGPERFAERARFLAPPDPEQTEHARRWLQWRADQLNRFYRQIQAELKAVRPEGRLYLAGANMFGGKQLRRRLRPALPQTQDLTEVLLRLGIDLRHYAADDGPVLLRPEQIAPQWSLARQAVNLQVRQMLDQQLAAEKRAEPRSLHDLAVPGSLFFHKPQELRLGSFDEKSPFKPSYMWLATEAVPSGKQNRRRFVHSLARLDAQAMFDGGWQLPMGQEESLRKLVAAYRQLPAVRFQTLEDPPEGPSSQPVTVRYATCGDSTYVYVVNDAPFSTTARLQVSSPTGCRLEELSGVRQVPPLRRDADGSYWAVEMEPYDLVAVRLSAPGVRLSGLRVAWPSEVQAVLESRLAEVADRVAALGKPPVMEVLANPGFERPPTPDGRTPGWAASNQEGTSIGLDADHPRGGARCMRMASVGPVATLISEPFDPPATGRLTMSVWLRCSDVARQPPLQLALVGKLDGRDFFRYARVGLDNGAQPPVPQLRPGWQSIVVPAELPLEGLSRLQIRFDLLGPGEVWIDDVQLCELAFTKKERAELFKLIAPADWKLQRGEVGDCVGLLESYWPRFLLAHVPTAETPLKAKPQPASRPAPKEPRKPIRTTGLLERMKNLLPGLLRF